MFENGYRYYGTISLSGSMTVITNTEDLYSNITLSKDKAEIENSVSEEIKKWLYNDYGKAPEDQKEDNATIVDVVTNFDTKNNKVSLGWKFGSYNLSSVGFVFDNNGKTIYAKGSITKNNDNIPIDDRFMSSSSLTINMDMTFIRDGKDAEKEQTNYLHEFAVGLKYTLSVTGTVISFIPNPISKGVGFGMRGIAFGMSEAGV